MPIVEWSKVSRILGSYEDATSYNSSLVENIDKLANDNGLKVSKQFHRIEHHELRGVMEISTGVFTNHHIKLTYSASINKKTDTIHTDISLQERGNVQIFDDGFENFITSLQNYQNEAVDFHYKGEGLDIILKEIINLELTELRGLEDLR